MLKGLDDVAKRLGVSTSELVREGVTLRLALAAVLAAADEGQDSSALLGETLRHIERWRAPAQGRMRTLVEGTDHGRGPQWVKLSDDDARHEMTCNGATFEQLRRQFRSELQALPGTSPGTRLGCRTGETSDETDC